MRGFRAALRVSLLVRVFGPPLIGANFSDFSLLFKVNSVHIRCIVKTSVDLQGVFVKILDFIKYKGFSCGIPKEQAILRKSKAPRKLPEKWTSLSLAFYNAPSLDTVNKIWISHPKGPKIEKNKILKFSSD